MACWVGTSLKNPNYVSDHHGSCSLCDACWHKIQAREPFLHVFEGMKDPYIVLYSLEPCTHMVSAKYNKVCYLLFIHSLFLISLLGAKYLYIKRNLDNAFIVLPIS